MELVVQYRKANTFDIPAMALVRAKEWETEQYWNNRILGYLNGEVHPQKALKPRILYVALESDKLVGFIAGHLTRRYECHGELEWINVLAEYRKRGIASRLLELLANWFVDQQSLRICVDVSLDNIEARSFYRYHGAENLNKHWLLWRDISVILKNR